MTTDHRTIRAVTSWNTDGIITQHMGGFDDYVTKMSRWILNTREDGVKKALIDLGWTPQKEKECQ